MKIAIDMYGGDNGLKVTFPAIKQALADDDLLYLLLFGAAAELSVKVEQLPKKSQQRVTICNAPQKVTMDDALATLLRQKPNSSMRQAILAVANGRADAAVSAGNTAGLMALSRLLLKTCQGISRPALVSAIPTQKSRCYMLDLGANVDVSAEQLLEFAVMGHYVGQVFTQLRYPKIALLNIGHEEIKGNAVVKKAHQLLLAQPNLNYIGFIEGHEIFQHKADIIVCDGMLGNVALKTAEGTATFFAQTMKQLLDKNSYTRLASLPLLPVLKGLKKQLNPHTLNGAPLVGVTKNIIKSHGNASVAGFINAIDVAKLCCQNNLPEAISQGVEG